MNPSITFNALGNELCGQILLEMPERGVLYQYSNIGMKALGTFNPEEFLFQNKILRGFWVSRYIETIPESDIERFKKP